MLGDVLPALLLPSPVVLSMALDIFRMLFVALRLNELLIRSWSVLLS